MKHATNFDTRVRMKLDASVRDLKNTRIPTRPSLILLLLLTVLLSLLWSVQARAQSKGATAQPWWIPEGYKIIEGDILVPIDFDALRFPYQTNLWPNGIVRYEFDRNVSDATKAKMRDAMAAWEGAANVHFVEVTCPFLCRDNLIHITEIPGGASDSHVGRVGFGFLGLGRQDLHAGVDSCVGVYVHELGHALGADHEQNRPDRDNYIRVNLGNVAPDEWHNFDINGRIYGPYDFDSVMHYGQYTFSSNGQPTMTVLPPNESKQAEIGRRCCGDLCNTPSLSDMDKLIMSSLYPYDNWRFVDQSSTERDEDGSFLKPYRPFIRGADAVPAGGTLKIQPGTYSSASGEYTKPMTLEAPLGSVVLTGGLCCTANEGSSCTVTCPDGMRIESILHVKYGSNAGFCTGEGRCDGSGYNCARRPDSCIGQRSCTWTFNNDTCGDTCRGWPKKGALVVRCSNY